MLARRLILFGLGAACTLLGQRSSAAQSSAVPRAGGSAYDFAFDRIDGEPMPLSQFRGQVLLIVNTASRCGFTNQYAGLQNLWTRNWARGLTVIGVPSNDFGGQEPGTQAEIKTFCSANFGVTFPLTSKVSVRGDSAHPFYRWAATQQPGAVPKWNFHKLLINRRGELVRTFPTSTAPDSRAINVAVELMLTGA